MRKETRWERNLQKRLDKQILISTNVIKYATKLEQQWATLFAVVDTKTQELMKQVETAMNEAPQNIIKLWRGR